MRIIRDTDTVEFTDDSGDKLVLLKAPRRRDIKACEDVEREDAMRELEGLRALGIDPITEAEKATAEERAVATAAVASAPAADSVRRFRFGALARKLVVDGEAIDDIMAAYDDMPADSTAWVDAQVASVWEAATPSEADTK